MSVLTTLQCFAALLITGHCLVMLAKTRVEESTDHIVVIVYSIGEAIGLTWLIRLLTNLLAN